MGILIITVNLGFDFIPVYLVFILCLIRQKIRLDCKDVLPFIFERSERNHVLRKALSIAQSA